MANDGIIIRITAYHGEPKLIGKLPTRSGVSTDTVVASSEIVNDLDGIDSCVRDLALASNDVNESPGGTTEYTLDQLIDDFEDEFGCKVNFGDQNTDDGVHEFDVFEPSWKDQTEAQDVIDSLTERLTDWVNGYPTGR